MLMKPSQLEAAQARLNNYNKPYLGFQEFSIVLGISKPNLSNRRQRGQLPVPDYELKMGPVWTKEQIAVWLEQENTKC